MEPLSIAAGVIGIYQIPRNDMAQGRITPWCLDEKTLKELIKGLVTCPETTMRLTRALNSLISATTTQSEQQVHAPERRRIQQRPPQISTPVDSTTETLQPTSNTTQTPRPRNCNGCSMRHLLWTTVTASSLAIGLWRSLSTGDEGRGFTVAAYVFAVGSALVLQFQNRHRERCLRRVFGSEGHDDIV